MDATPGAEGQREGQRTRSKRSQTVSLVLVAGAGAAALGLGGIDPSQREEDVLVYADAAACTAEGIRPEDECRGEYAVARQAYPTAAPRYAGLIDCERHHGPGHCLSGSEVGGGPSVEARAGYLPRMAGYLIGRRASQGITPQPVFDHAPRAGHAAAAAGHGGYCTGGGARILTGSGGRASAGRMRTAALHGTTFGGFGQTGRAFSASSHGSTRSSWGG
jgi:uncharacterized protein YgiB involved in biofilm formation